KEDLVEITGRVTDGETGEALIGAAIRIKGTSRGTITDLDGDFTLSAEEDDVLEVSFLGYETREIPVSGQRKFDVSLMPATASLEELIVVGYGTKKKSNLTGSIAIVSNDDIEKSKQHDLISVLQGRAAGVQVTTSSGAPGGGMTIRVRGAS